MAKQKYISMYVFQKNNLCFGHNLFKVLTDTLQNEPFVIIRMMADGSMIKAK